MKLIDRYRHSYEGPAWHGPDTMEILKGVTSEQAAARPIPNAHTIAELVAHITTWRDFAIHILRGDFDYRVEIGSDADWRTSDGLTTEEWELIKERLQRSQIELVELLEQTRDDVLDQQAGDRPFTVRVIVDGVIDHDIYHGGQMVLLKKMVQGL